MTFAGPKVPADIAEQLRRQTPTWGTPDSDPKAIKSTWLGHACFFVELPAPEGAAKGATILFDPVFSHRCSPSQIIGPQRYTSTFNRLSLTQIQSNEMFRRTAM